MTSTVLPLVTTAIAVFVPGLLVGFAARLPLFLSVTAAPVITFGLVSLGSQVVQLFGLPWTVWSFAVVTLVIAVLVAAVAQAAPRLRQRWLTWPAAKDGRSVPGPVWRTRPDVLLLVVAAAASVLAAGVMVAGMGGLEGINQEFDVLFHVNAIALISESHNADPAAVGAVNHYAVGTTSYPVAFHALGALVADLGFPAVVAANTLVALVPTVLVFGLTGLLWQVGLRRQALAVPLVAIGIAQFPTDLLWRGPLWPFALGVAMIPGFMALLSRAFEQGARNAALATALGAAGLLAVHPSAALGAAIFAAAFFLQRWFTRRAAFRADLLPLAAVVVATILLALPAVLTALANSKYGAAYDWPAVQTPGWAIGELVTFNYFAATPQVWLFAFLVVGVVAIRRLSRFGWWFAASAVFAVLMVMAAAYEGTVVQVLTGPWWNDRFRFVALATLGLAVLCAHGVVVIAEWGVRMLGRLGQWRPSLARTATPAAAILVVLAVFGLVSQGFYASYNDSRLGMKFDLGTGGSVTEDDLAAFEYLASVSKPGETVMNDPGDGSAWMWALEGIRPMFGQAILDPPVPPLEPDQDVALYDFNCIDSSTAVRDVVARYNIRHVFVSQSFIFPQMYRSEGMRSLFASHSLRLAYANPGAQVYEVQLSDLIPRSEDIACQIGDSMSAEYRSDPAFGSLDN